MGWQHTPFTIPLLLGAAVQFLLLLYLLAHRSIYRRVPGAQTASLLLVASMVWMLTYAFELASEGYAMKLFWNKAQYFGSATLPLLLFVYVLMYTGYDHFVKRSTIAGLSIIPATTVLLAITNESHNLIWERTYMDASGAYSVLINYHGPGFHVFIAYTYALVLVGLALLGNQFIHSKGFYRWQTGGLFVGALAPTIGGLIYVSGQNPVPHLNLPALSFIVTSMIVGWSVFRHHLFAVTPIARDTVIEEMDAAVLVINNHDRVVDANQAAQEFVGWDGPTIVGESFDDVWPEHAHMLVDEQSREFHTEAINDTADGREYYDLRVTPLTNEDGSLVGRLIVLRDVTHRKRRERELERKNEQLEEFASVLSHDLRNPLSVARGYLDLAHADGDDDAFERVEHAHERIERIIEDMLTLTRQGQTVSETEQLDLEAVAVKAWANVATPQGELNVTESRALNADETRLLQLLENLFSNAVEHGSTAPRSRALGANGATSEHTTESVTVEVGPLPDGFYVEDDGPGIPEPRREEVFTYGHSSREDGTGLGLSIVKSIAEAHGWEVSIGEGEAGGARFEITRR